MFTCKMCNKYNTCTDKHKSTKISEGESWAYYCDDFYSKVPVYSYEDEKYLVSQSPYNYHCVIVDKQENRIVFHSQTSKPLSKKKLKEFVEFYVELTETAFDEIYEEEEADND